MEDGLKVCAIIPARGGSKGIPKKNIANIAGKPLMAYSIDHAIKCPIVGRVIVSTDSQEIANIAKDYGAEVPFMRPSELAGDEVLDLPVFQHALEWLCKNEQYEPDVIVHLRPTSPIRKPEWIDEAVRKLLENHRADSVRSVSEPGPHPYRMFDINEDGFLEPLLQTKHKEPFLLRRQELPPVYWYNCVIDITYPRTVFEKASMTGDFILPYIMESRFVVDIDGPDDIVLTETKIKLFERKFS